MLHLLSLMPTSRLSETSDLEILFFLEEHPKADNSAVDQETANDRHDHGRDGDDGGMCQDGR